jgi:ABC-type Co2+ transport system permease subunit
MIYGTPACVLAAAAYGLLAAISLRRGFPGTAWTLCVCVAYMVCEAFLYSTAYHLLRPANLFLAIVAMAFVSYLVTSLLRYRNESWTDRVPLLLNSFLAASCAAFLAVFPHPFIAVVAIPMVAVIRYWTKIHEGRLGGVGIQEISTAPRSTQ